MAEEGKNPSPRRSRESSVWDEAPSGIDRKSLSGMSDSVKAILAPLLGGTKRHSEVKVDLGRDPDSAPYDSVPTGTTSMHRYSTVEHMAAAEAASSDSSSGTSTDRNPKRASYVPRPAYATQPRSSYAVETLNRETSANVKINNSATDDTTDANPKSRPSYTSRAYHALENLHRSPEKDIDTETTSETSPQVSQPRASYAKRRSYVPRRSAVKSKGKDEVKDEDDFPTYARVEKLMSATKPKMEEYDNYLKESGPQLRARVSSILADKSHEAGFQRRLPEGDGMELPSLDARPVYGEASGATLKTGPPSLFDKVKDTVTGQVPGRGIYSGRATSDQDAGMGKFARDSASDPEVADLVPRHMNGPNEKPA